MKLYNLTLHRQEQLAKLDTDFDVEIEPRLRPVKDPADYKILKSNVMEAVRDIPPGSAVVVGGLGQYQALIMQLQFQFYFVDFDTQVRAPRGLIRHETFNRNELFAIENGGE